MAAAWAKKAVRHKERSSSSLMAATAACATPYHSSLPALARMCMCVAVRMRARALRSNACVRKCVRVGACLCSSSHDGAQARSIYNKKTTDDAPHAINPGDAELCRAARSIVWRDGCGSVTG
jgi:hypothetical protein